MKKILTLVALLGAFAMGANAQRTANLSAIMLSPDTGNVTTLNCVDSYVVATGFINKGPDMILPTDTIVFVDAFSQQGYVWYTSGDTVNVNDTIVGEVGYYHVSDLNFLYDGTSGAAVYGPFANGNYFFGSTFVGFGLHTTSTAVVYDDSTDFQIVAPVTIECTTTSIKDLKNGVSLKVYPNPATSQISFNYDFTAATEASLRVTDIAGRVVKTITLGKQNAGSKTFNVDIAELNNGMYYIELATETTRSISKFTKN